MQWQNLIPLIDNALSGQDFGDKGTLMIVGDPKLFTAGAVEKQNSLLS
jgi:hypothetical protein